MKRARFQGTLNILKFNRKFYLIGASLLILFILISYFLSFPTWITWTCTLVILYGLLSSIIVSAIVYDISEFYTLNWLKKLNLNDHSESLKVNIHSGFDDTSQGIANLFPNSDLTVFDFYNPELHTEPAIVIARKKSQIHPSTLSIATHHIPLPDASVDALFLIFSIHEIRENNERIHFLKECKRVCKSNGKIIIVEHLRDLPNFLAFTIGFTHFFSKAVWRNNFESAGFTSITEYKFTSFVSLFILSNDRNTP